MRILREGDVVLNDLDGYVFFVLSASDDEVSVLFVKLNSLTQENALMFTSEMTWATDKERILLR